MTEAEQALGHPIEIVSGREEARLIYKGVTHSLPPTDGPRLVMDIGGGSTELILGKGSEPRALESLQLGCVSMTERFFPGGQITPEGFVRARKAAQLELRPVKAFFRNADGVEVIGTSGTMRATEAVARELGFLVSGLTPDVVEQLIEQVLEFESTADMALRGLTERRAQVWPGGLAILAELLHVLNIRELQVSEGAMREGLLYQLLGRLQHEDERERTVRAMMARYQVDKKQARRVARTADALYAQAKPQWGFSSQIAGKALDWAARLHEIGLDISHDGYPQHGAYIAENADMPGFPRAEQRFLAALIGNHRNAIRRTAFRTLPQAWREGAMRLLIILRLAVLLNRSRKPSDIPPVKFSVGRRSLSLEFDPARLADHTITGTDREREAEFLQQVNYKLAFSPNSTG